MYRMSFGKSISQINSCQEEDKFSLSSNFANRNESCQMRSAVPTHRSYDFSPTAPTCPQVAAVAVREHKSTRRPNSRRLNRPRQLQFHFHHWIRLQNKIARTLKSPLHIRNLKRPFAVPVISVDLAAHRHITSCSDPCSPNFPCICTETAPLAGNFPSTRSGRNTTSRKLRALQNILMHLLVAPRIPALPARCIRYNFAAGFSVRLDSNRPSLQHKRPMHCVQRSPQRKIHLALRRIHRQDHSLRRMPPLRGRSLVIIAKSTSDTPQIKPGTPQPARPARPATSLFVPLSSV